MRSSMTSSSTTKTVSYTHLFEDPDAAFAEATMDFQTGIAAIQEQFDLEPFTPSNWEPYKTYGAQIPTEDETCLLYTSRCV